MFVCWGVKVWAIRLFRRKYSCIPIICFLLFCISCISFYYSFVCLWRAPSYHRYLDGGGRSSSVCLDRVPAETPQPLPSIVPQPALSLVSPGVYVHIGLSAPASVAFPSSNISGTHIFMHRQSTHLDLWPCLRLEDLITMDPWSFNVCGSDM